MKTVLITGANRGLGLEFCRQYTRDDWRVIATCRHPDIANDLNSLARQYANLQVHALDVADFSQIDALSQLLVNESIDVLINNAGIYADQQGCGVGQLDYQAWEKSFLINTLAAVKMAETFLPQLQKSKQKLIVSISSLMGSMADNASGGSLSYRSSKAALNAAMKSLSIELCRDLVGVLILHPGWVKTDMGGKNASITVEESVSGMRQQIEIFNLQKTGRFLNYEGAQLPW
ncbi:short-chain dehydrogenase [Methylomonas lenta]|uniref:Short-chain dehydrogenase n=1 Tax=Methylomonas lenta TaxID=980561 RepID=A0A177NT22_9GAMM|nr:SDR family oxidoreductase [Methylomonas lenta]OAI21227.1 short-chain dehydrogenase [Methylomonas lenta]